MLRCTNTQRMFGVFKMVWINNRKKINSSELVARSKKKKKTGKPNKKLHCICNEIEIQTNGKLKKVNRFSSTTTIKSEKELLWAEVRLHWTNKNILFNPDWVAKIDWGTVRDLESEKPDLFRKIINATRAHTLRWAQLLALNWNKRIALRFDHRRTYHKWFVLIRSQANTKNKLQWRRRRRRSSWICSFRN